MAGDWIKMRSNLRRHPKIVQISSALKADRLRVVGGLHAVWCLFDEHSEDGRLCGYTPSAIDEEIGFPGFSDLMIAIGWLNWDGNDGLSLPEFDTHNGASAKRRAQEADRKRAERASYADSTQRGGNLSASDADKKRTREEKRREEKNTPKPPAGGLRMFEEFWTAWPKSERKHDKVKCAKKWRENALDDVAEQILADIEVKRQTEKWRGGFIEAPLVYLNGRRWEDGAEPESAGQGSMWAGAV